MKIRAITDFLNNFAPLALQESYDNSGLNIGDPDEEVTGILICLDLNPEVLKEAKKTKCNLVITHHPLIFHPLKKITGETAAEKMVITAIRENIAVLASHTNLDNSFKGVSAVFANKIGLCNQKVLSPLKGVLRKLVVFCPKDAADKVRQAIFNAGAGHIGNYDCCSYNIEGLGSFRGNEETNPFVGEKNKLHFEPEVRIETIFPAFIQSSVIDAMIAAHPYEEVAYDVYPLENEFPHAGTGIIGELDLEIPAGKFLPFIKKQLGVSQLRYAEGKAKKIRKVAVCGGSGAFLICEALKKGADAFITADIKYHDFQNASGQILLIDAGHFETERYAKELLKNILSEKFPTFAVRISKVDINPVNYL
jgi:dinuclear metal center YbgI/SA1388 family protein